MKPQNFHSYATLELQFQFRLISSSRFLILCRIVQNSIFNPMKMFSTITSLKETIKPGSSVGGLFLWRLPSPPLPLRCWTECWCRLQPPSLPEPLQVYDLCQARLSLASLFCLEHGHCITRIALILRVNRLKPMLSGPPLSSEIKSLHYHLGDFSRPCPLTDFSRA